MKAGKKTRKLILEVSIILFVMFLSIFGLAGCGGGGSTGGGSGYTGGGSGATGSGSGAQLTAIQLDPANLSMPVGSQQKFTIMGIYSDNSRLDVSEICQCTSSNPDVATFDDVNEIATALKVGTTTITSKDPTSGITGSTTITVTNATLQAIQVSPMNPVIADEATQQFSATAIYSDNSTSDMTPFVSFTSSDTSVASIDSKGLAKGLREGTTTITATDPSTNMSGTTILTVGNSTVAPTITSVSPTSLKAGDQCTIIGDGFGSIDGKAVKATGVVYFGSYPCTQIISWADDKIVCIVPAGVITGSVNIIVQTASGATSPLSPTTQIVIVISGGSGGGGGGGGGGIPSPSLTKLTPSEGQAGDVIVITGSNFGISQGANSKVSFGDIDAGNALSWSDGQIILFAPAGIADPCSVKVSVDGRISNSLNFTVGTRAWNAEGDPPEFSVGAATYIDLFIYNGTPYVAFRDAGVGAGQIMVKKFNEETYVWEVVGGGPVSDGEGGYASLYVYNGVPYVAYEDGTTDPVDRLSVKKLSEDGDWDFVGGNEGLSPDCADDISLYIDEATGMPYVAYSCNCDMMQGGAVVKKFTGQGPNGWEFVGGDASNKVSDGHSSFTSLFIYNSTPYLAYSDGPHENPGKAIVKKYTGEGDTGWVALEDAEHIGGISQGAAQYVSLFVSNGEPYVAFEDMSTDPVGQISVMEFSDDHWEYVGSQGFSPDCADDISLYVYCGVPYVAYSCNCNVMLGGAVVKKFTGQGADGWEFVGGDVTNKISDGHASSTCLSIFDGKPYCVYSNGPQDDPGQAILKEYDL